jgi:hypothetical protein
MKKKLSLKEIEVNSFVTSMDNKLQENIKGGAETKLGLCNLLSIQHSQCWSCGIQCDETFNCR